MLLKIPSEKGDDFRQHPRGWYFWLKQLLAAQFGKTRRFGGLQSGDYRVIPRDHSLRTKTY